MDNVRTRMLLNFGFFTPTNLCMIIHLNFVASLKHIPLKMTTEISINGSEVCVTGFELQG